MVSALLLAWSFFSTTILGPVVKVVAPLLEAALKTPLGAAIITAIVVYPVADWHGGHVERQRQAAAVAVEVVRRAAFDASDRRDAKADSSVLAAKAAARAAIFEEISHAPIPIPRPGDRGVYDGSRLR
ncbi:hypothetical protein EYW49_21965 [Siculibacillus lacustris]|uniref:Uncharacterized protein n=1 Tax=Siculibacillus lacustris TaxID=1549641 RepID=A0A4Q9VDA5_9HYPH|nr:hypothetical protein [Siculibacillus lacustris]TBW32607.1 hypothetical protein EYW49_21965 [Siculibacillus lacustris]